MKKLAFLMTSAIITANAWQIKDVGDFSFKNINSNVSVMHGPIEEPNEKNLGFMNNPALIEGKSGLIVIDPGGNYNVGLEILKEVQKVSKKPVVAILNTHKHGDHWFANLAFKKAYPNVKIYAHPNMIKEVKAGEAEKWYGILDRLSHNLKGTKPFAFPTYELKDGQLLKIDGEKFKISLFPNILELASNPPKRPRITLSPKKIVFEFV